MTIKDHGQQMLSDLGKTYLPVSLNREGIKVFVYAVRRKMETLKSVGITQEQVADQIGLSRTTFAAILDVDRIPKTDSVNLPGYINVLRFLRPTWPGKDTEMTEDDLIHLLTKQETPMPVTRSCKSKLGEAIEAQIQRNAKREVETYQEAYDYFCSRWEAMPIDMKTGRGRSHTKEEARARVAELISGEIIPDTELETAFLATLVEKEDGDRSQYWIKELAGLLG